VIEKTSETHGKVYEYLGMNLNFENPGKVGFSMKQYVETVLEKAPEDMDGEAATPAANHRFDVRGDDSEPLDSEKADLFHHMVAKLLFLCKRARPGIQTAVAFLCTRVKSPDTDDYKKTSTCYQILTLYT
jgi:hypothetical protein